MVRDGAGRYLMVGPYQHRIKVFDISGRYLKSIGTEGSGPGEFRQLVGLCPLPDNRLTAIELSDRVTSMDTRGRLEHSYRPPVANIKPTACFPDGSVLARRAPADRSCPVADHSRVSPSGEVLATYAALPRPLFEPDRREVFFAVSHDSLYVAAGDEGVVLVYTPDGGLFRVVRLSDPPRTVSPESPLALRGAAPPLGSGDAVPPCGTSRFRPASLPCVT